MDSSLGFTNRSESYLLEAGCLCASANCSQPAISSQTATPFAINNVKSSERRHLKHQRPANQPTITIYPKRHYQLQSPQSARKQCVGIRMLAIAVFSSTGPLTVAGMCCCHKVKDPKINLAFFSFNNLVNTGKVAITYTCC